MRSTTGFFAQFIIGLTAMALNTLFFAVAGLLRLLPTVLPFVLRGLWVVVLLSRRLYGLLLTRLTALTQKRFKINLLQGLWRVAATTLLSLILGLLFYLFVSFPVNGWTVSILVLHGLFIGLTWDEKFDSGGLITGVKIPWEN